MSHTLYAGRVADVFLEVGHCGCYSQAVCLVAALSVMTSRRLPHVSAGIVPVGLGGVPFLWCCGFFLPYLFASYRQTRSVWWSLSLIFERPRERRGVCHRSPDPPASYFYGIHPSIGRSIASFRFDGFSPQIARVGKMLADEYGTATNIKSRVNKLSVLSAITSTQQRLK